MVLLGITGGVGMGKSAVGKLLKARGVPVVECDVIARELVRPGEPALREIISAFGEGVLEEGGQLDRGRLARIIFDDAGQRSRLEAILHPRIRARWLDEVRGWHAKRIGLGAVVIPLLFETEAAGAFDCTVCVACSGETQLRRLVNRHWDEGEVARRVGAQWPIERKMEAATFVIWNEGPMEVLACQLARILATTTSP